MADTLLSLSCSLKAVGELCFGVEQGGIMPASIHADLAVATHKFFGWCTGFIVIAGGFFFFFEEWLCEVPSSHFRT